MTKAAALAILLGLIVPAGAQTLPSTGGGGVQPGTVGNCGKYVTTTEIGDFGAPCGGTGSPGGTSGQVQFNSAGSFGGFTVGGDGSLNTGTGALTISKIGGVGVVLGGALTTTGASTPTLAFPASGIPTYTFPATTKTLAASDLSNASGWPTSGDLMLAPASGAPTAYAGTAGAAHQWLNALSAAGAGTFAQPGFSDLTGAATFAQLPAVTGPTILGRVTNTSGAASAAYTPSNGTDTAVPLVHGATVANDCPKFSDTTGTLIDSGAGCGGGGSTTITAGPGLGNSQTSFNGTGAAQTVTNGSTLYPQLSSAAKTAAYVLNADCSAGVLCDTARVILANGAASIAVTAPTAAGTIAPYQIADEAGHGFTVPTVGGTDTFKGCVAGTPTTLTVPANYSVQLFDQGAGNGYYCVFQFEDSVLPVANGGTGLSSGTSGGVLAFTASGTLASSGALTANLPVIGGGAGAAPTVGTRSGNTTEFGTVSGSLTSGNCIKSDASGNLIDAATTCGGGSGGQPGETSGYAAGHVYGPWPGGYGTGAAAVGANGLIECAPLTIYSPGVHVDSLNVDVTTAAASTHIALAIYNSGSNGLPSTLLVNTASLSTAATGVAAGAVTSTALAAGNYWLCAQVDTNTADFVVLSGSTVSGATALLGSDTAADYFGQNQTSVGFKPFPYFIEGTYGTWPSLTSLWSASQYAAGMPAIVWHAASVP